MKTLDIFTDIYNGQRKSYADETSAGFKFQVKHEEGLGLTLYINGEFKYATYTPSDLITVIEEEERNHIASIEYQAAIEKERQLKIAKGAKDFDLVQIKKLLIEVIPEYIGITHEALSGSEYIMINGREVRFSDHVRPATSKWNFVHGDHRISPPEGLIFPKEIEEFIEKTLGIKDYNKSEIQNFFLITKTQQS